MFNLPKFTSKSLSARLSLMAVSQIALLLLVALIVMFCFSRNALRDEAMREAEQTLEGTVQQIDNILLSVEQTTGIHYGDILAHLDQPDNMETYCRRIVESNPYIVGCAIAFKPNYYSDRDTFMVYVHRKGYEIKISRNVKLVTQNFFTKRPYTEQAWYTEPMKSGRARWIDPLKDDFCEGEPLTSFCIPLFDKDNNCIGVVASDLPIRLLTKIVLDSKSSPNGYATLLARNGSYIVHPNIDKLTHQTVFFQMDYGADHTVLEACEAMLAGEKGHKFFRMDGRDWYVFYKPFERVEVPGRSMEQLGWSVGVVRPEDDIVGDYNKLLYYLLAIAIIGIVVLYVLCRLVIHRQLKQGLSMRSCVDIILMAAPTFIIALGILFFQSRYFIHEGSMEHANSLLNTSMHRVRNYLGTVETSANACTRLMEEFFTPDSIESISNRTLKQNTLINSCTVNVEPDKFPLDAGKSCWIEPFNKQSEDSIDPSKALATYREPIDKDGQVAGVLSVTFSFNQLEEVLKEANKVYPEAFLMLLGSDGRYLVHPDTTVLFRKTIFTDIDPIKQSDIIALGHEMVAGKHGNIHVTIDGEPCHACYCPIPGTNWSLALVCANSDIMTNYHKLIYIIFGLIIIGLLVILWIGFRVVKKTIKQQANLTKAEKS